MTLRINISLVFLLFLVLQISTRALARGGGGGGGKRPSIYSRYDAPDFLELMQKKYPAVLTWSSLKLGIFFARDWWRSTTLNTSEAGDVNICASMKPVAAPYNSSIRVPWYYRGQIVYGVFSCPLEQDEPWKTYCCGDIEEAYCCGFWDDVGRLIGVIIGIIAAVVLVIAGAIFLYINCIREEKRYPTANQMPMQGQQPGEEGQNTLPPSYSSATGPYYVMENSAYQQEPPPVAYPAPHKA